MTQDPAHPHTVLRDAERQMAKHHLDTFRDLMAKAIRCLPADANEAEMREAIERLVEDDPEARELVERLKILDRFR